MSNSNLVSYIDSGSSNYNQRTAPISKITVHHAAGKLTLDQFTGIMHSGREVSWNYAIANDGSIGLYIPEMYRAWTTSSRENDNVAITIEVSNSMNGEPWPISDAAYASLINLCEDICRRNNIKAIQFTGDKSGNLTMHKWFASTGCPGPTLSTKFVDIMQQVNKRLGQPCTLQYITNPLTGDVTAAGFGDGMVTMSIDVLSLIDYTQFTPYVATLDRNVGDVDYKKLKEAGVNLVMIEAGRLYNAQHKIMDVYANPHIDKQVINAGKESLDYGLVADVRARSVEEANKELKELTLIIQKYTPPYGMWLNINLTADKSINNKIIDRYAFVLQALGLKDKIGLYATREQMEKIDWNEDRQNVWYLWLNNHVHEEKHLTQLQSPEFFMFDKEKASDEPVINTTISMYSGMSDVSTISDGYDEWVFSGDSRTRGMYLVIQDFVYYAKDGGNYDYFKSVIPKLKEQHNKNIVLWFGVNDTNHIDKYIAAYNDLSTSCTDCKIIAVTVGPVNGHADSVHTSGIKKFNAKLKTSLNSNIAILDLYQVMMDNEFSTVDGIHYTNSTYKKIYNYITTGEYKMPT